MFELGAADMVRGAHELESKAVRLEIFMEDALDSAAEKASAAGYGKGKYPWTHPAQYRRVIYHTPWYTRFVENGRDEYTYGEARHHYLGRSSHTGGNKNVGHGNAKCFHFVVNGQDVFTTKLGAIKPRGDSMVAVEQAATQEFKELGRKLADFMAS